MRLQGRTALITGASRQSGIGATICYALAAEGANIFFTHWSAYDQQMPWGAEADTPDSLRSEILAMGVRCEHLATDLSQPDAPARILDSAETHLGAVSILINNAAYSTNGGYDTLDADIIDAHYAVNMRGTMLLSAEFARRFTGKSGGRIINLTSGQSLGPMPDELAYIATKGAIEAFTTSLAAGVAGRGITVNAVDPGPTDTGWMSDETRAYVLAHMPQGRIGIPEDAARLIVFLASEEAAWITGQIIHSDGGFLRG